LHTRLKQTFSCILIAGEKLSVTYCTCGACATLNNQRDRAETAYVAAFELLCAGEGRPADEYLSLRVAADDARLDLTVAQIELRYHRCACVTSDLVGFRSVAQPAWVN
jgi:hypothetical protein